MWSVRDLKVFLEDLTGPGEILEGLEDGDVDNDGTDNEEECSDMGGIGEDPGDECGDPEAKEKSSSEELLSIEFLFSRF